MHDIDSNGESRDELLTRGARAAELDLDQDPDVPPTIVKLYADQYHAFTHLWYNTGTDSNRAILRAIIPQIETENERLNNPNT